MAGRITASDSQLRPDPQYNDLVLSRFINCVMYGGEKAVAQRVVVRGEWHGVARRDGGSA